MKRCHTAPGLSIEPLESRIAPAGDLVIQNILIQFPSVAVPGDTGTVAFDVKNVHPTDPATSGGQQTGFHVYFSADGLFQGEFTDPLIGAVRNKTVDLAPGESVTYKAKVVLPGFTLPSPKFGAGNYSVLVQADTGFRVPEGNEGNNIGASAQKIDYRLQFGAVGDRTGVKLSATDAEGDVALFSISGPGTGVFSNDGAVPLAGNALRLAVTGTTEKSVVSAKGGRVDIGTIDVPGAAKAFLFDAVNLARNATFGDVAVLVLGHVGLTGLPSSAQQTLSLAGTTPSKLVFDRVFDAGIQAPTKGLASFFATEWIDLGSGADKIVADFIGRFTVGGSRSLGLAGESAVGIDLDGADKNGIALGTAKIAGALTGGLWKTANAADPSASAIGSISSAGADGWSLDAQGPVGKLAIGSDLFGSTGTPAIKALAFDKIAIGDVLGASIEATGSRDGKYGIGSLKSGLVAAGVKILSQDEGIKSLAVDGWTGGGIIQADWIGKLRSGGDFDPSLDLFGPLIDPLGNLISSKASKGMSLGEAVIEGDIAGGLWNFRHRAGKISAENIGPNWALVEGEDLFARDKHKATQITAGGSVTGNLIAGSDMFLKAGGTLSLFMRLNGMAAIIKSGKITNSDFADFSALTFIAEEITDTSAAADLFSTLTTWGDAGNGDIRNLEVTATNRFSISADGSVEDSRFHVTGPSDGASLFAANRAVTDTVLQLPATAGFNFVRAGSWQGGKIDAGSIESLWVTSGGITGAMIDLRDPAAEMRGFSVQGGIEDSMIHLAAAKVKEFIAGAMTDTLLDAPDTAFGKISVGTAKANPGFASSNILADIIAQLVLRGVNGENGTVDFGVISGAIGSYTRFADGKSAFAAKDLSGSQLHERLVDFVVQTTA